jgi:hypothetical protein
MKFTHKVREVSALPNPQILELAKRWSKGETC